MPKLHHCRAHHCNRLIPHPGYCATHSTMLRELYNSAAWARIRTYVLERDPTCAICELHPSNQVAHLGYTTDMIEAGTATDPDHLAGVCSSGCNTAARTHARKFKRGGGF